jgi:hypothetical protein
LNITKVSYSRKYNLGNYETLDVAAEAVLNEKDNPLEVWTILADNTEMWYIAEKNKKANPQPKQPSTPQPQVTQPKPETVANIDILKEFTEEQEKRLTAERKGDYWKINPKHFLAPTVFGQISEVVKGLGGKYVPASPDVPGHWTVPL